MPFTVICPSCHERNPGSLLTCRNCQTSLVGIPREEYPPTLSTPLNQEAISSPTLKKSTEESLGARLSLLLAKAVGIACLLGSLVSFVGWQYLHWSSSRHFSDGLFWTGAAVGVLGYYIYRGEVNGRRAMLTAGYAGTLSVQERTKHWVSDAASSYRVTFHFFLVALCLMGFSVLIWNLF